MNFSTILAFILYIIASFPLKFARRILKLGFYIYHVLQLFILVDHNGDGTVKRFLPPVLGFSSLITHLVLPLILCLLILWDFYILFTCLYQLINHVNFGVN